MDLQNTKNCDMGSSSDLDLSKKSACANVFCQLEYKISFSNYVIPTCSTIYDPPECTDWKCILFLSVKYDLFTQPC